MSNLATLIGPALSSFDADAANSSFRSVVDAVPESRWDEDLARFSDASLEQSAVYSRGRWGGGHDSHLLLQEKGRTVAMARVVTYRLPLIGRGLAYVKFGPAWRPTGGDARLTVYRRILAELMAEYSERRGLLLTIQPRPSPTNQASEETILDELGFVPRRPMASPDRFFVDLSLGPDELHRSLDQKWRYNLKKAERAGVTVSIAAGGDAFELFSDMHREMVARKNASDGDPIDLLPSLDERLPADFKPTVIIASHGGEPVAGAVVATFGDTAYYLYGASRGSALKVNAGYALHWWVVGWLAAGKARWYDLGGAPEGSALRQFKGGLTGKRGHVLPQLGERDYWIRADQRIAADLLFYLRNAGRGLQGRIFRGRKADRRA